VSRTLSLDEVGVSADRLGDRVGDGFLVLRGLLGVRKKPRASYEGTLKLEGELGPVDGKKVSDRRGRVTRRAKLTL
jgi:hypothetical protein